MPFDSCRETDCKPGVPARRDTRRRFLARAGRWTFGSVALLMGGAASGRAEASANDVSSPRLEDSEFAYISPLRSDGQESRCHAELWYAWLDESVVVIVAKDGWKATAERRGLDRARVWIGNHGRWKGWFGSRNESFRNAPPLECRVERSRDASLLDRLLASYARKYPDEIADWRDRMRNGFEDGSRVLLRYQPLGRPLSRPLRMPAGPAPRKSV
jgi:hypothetical protein